MSRCRTAFIAAAEWMAGVTDEDLQQRFSAARAADYGGLAAEIREELASRGDRGAGGRRAQLRQRLGEIAAIDWFGAPGREEVERLLEPLESETDRPPADGAFPAAVAELRGLTWDEVTAPPEGAASLGPPRRARV